MTRTLAVLLALSAACLAGCSSTEQEWTPEVKEEGGDKTLQITSRKKRSTGVARAAEWAYVGPLNVVWWPWKMVGQGTRGIVDGVGAGFDEGRLPLFGLVFSPLNAATGLGTGLVEGFAMSPYLLNPDMNLSRTMGKPVATGIHIWWYK